VALGMRPQFDTDFPGDSFGSDGKLLARAFDALESAARRCGATPLSAFMDYRPIPEEVVADPEALEEFQEDWDEWFPSADGAGTARHSGSNSGCWGRACGARRPTGPGSG